MKLSHFFKIVHITIISFTFFTFKICAVEYIDERVKNLTLELRCMTCQNQSIYDSDAEFSNDIKKIVKQKLQEGESERDIKNFLISRSLSPSCNLFLTIFLISFENSASES